MLDTICAVTNSDSYIAPEAPVMIETSCDCAILIKHALTFNKDYLCDRCGSVICKDCKHFYSGNCRRCDERE